MKNERQKVSLGDIARHAGISRMTVSRALQNKPGIGPATRQRVMRIARELGYVPNARLSSLMAQVRMTTAQDLLPIAWLNASEFRDSWHRFRFHSPYLEGASARAMELGYGLEEIWVREPGMTMKRLSSILYQRGIEGAIVTLPARHFRLDWDHLASVALGASLLAPRLHRVTADLNFNLRLALKSVKKLGYERIGICLWPQVDSSSHYAIRATARDLYFSASRKKQIPPLFHSPDRAKRGEIQKLELAAWLDRYKPEVVVGHDHRLKAWAEAAGYRVPQDVGIVHLALDDDVLDWAGIYSRRREIGATAVDQVVSLIRNRQFGVPKVPLEILIRGSWRMGHTLDPLRP
jgi:LacI family transcriptional regulator